MRLLRHVWVLPIALGACAAPAHWEKAGASQATVNEDMQQCRLQARIAPEAHTQARGTISGGSLMLDRPEEREARETQHFQKCMQDRGYSAKR